MDLAEDDLRPPSWAVPSEQSPFQRKVALPVVAKGPLRVPSGREDPP